MSAAARCAGEGAAGTEGAAAVTDDAGAAGGRDEGGVGVGAHPDGGAVEALFFERLRLLLHGLTSGGDVDAGGSRRMRKLGDAAGVFFFFPSEQSFNSLPMHGCARAPAITPKSTGSSLTEQF